MNKAQHLMQESIILIKILIFNFKTNNLILLKLIIIFNKFTKLYNLIRNF